MICSNCGSINDDFQTVCIECGEPLTPGFVMCPSCGKVLKEGSKICPRCNTNVIEKTIIKNERIEKVAVTPKYVVKAPLSMPAILSVCLFFLYSLVYNIVVLVKKFDTIYQDMKFLDIIYLIFSNEIRPFVLLVLSILSLITLYKRVTINSLTTIDELNKRLITLKCLLATNTTGFFVYFFISFWPTVFEQNNPLYYLGAALGIMCFIISLVSLPLFFKNAKVRTR